MPFMLPVFIDILIKGNGTSQIELQCLFGDFDSLSTFSCAVVGVFVLLFLNTQFFFAWCSWVPIHFSSKPSFCSTGMCSLCVCNTQGKQACVPALLWQLCFFWSGSLSQFSWNIELVPQHREREKYRKPIATNVAVIVFTATALFS